MPPDTPKVLDRFRDLIPAGDLWVFGYGSLMWDPGFEYARKSPAFLYGFHRDLCIYSTRYRGTPTRPGLVLGLAPGGSCHGMGFLVGRTRVTEALLSLWQREMRNRSYHPRLLAIRIAGRRRRALAFVADQDHANYANGITFEGVVEMIAHARGKRGPNVDYLINTIDHLRALGVSDRRLRQILHAVLSHACDQCPPQAPGS